MALARQVIDIPLGGGIDEGVDPKLMPAGKLRRLKNAVMTRTGEIAHRQGIAALSLTTIPAGSLGPSHRLHSRGDSLHAFNDSAVYTYSADQDKWLPGDWPSEFATRSAPVVRTNEVRNDVTYAYNSGLHFFAWVDYTGTTQRIAIRVYDAITGALVDSADQANTTAIGAGINPTPKLVAVGNYVLLFYLTTTADPVLQCMSFNTASVSSGWGAETHLHTDVSVSAPCFDVIGGSSTAKVAYNGTDPVGGGVCITVETVGTDKVVQSACYLTGTESNGVIALGQDVNASRVWAAWITPVTGELWCGVTNAATSAVTTAAQLQYMPPSNIAALAVVGASSSRALLFCSSTVDERVFTIGTSDVASPDATATTAYNVTLAAKPFNASLRFYVPVRAGGGDDNAHLALLDYGIGTYATRPTSHMRTAAVSEMGLAGVHRQVNTLPEVQNTTAVGLWQFAQGVINYGALAGCQGIDLITLDKTTSKRNLCENAGTLTAVTGGLPQWFDGKRLVEMGFMHAPYTNTATKAAGAGLDAGATYSYRFCYEWLDNQGNLHRSAPSAPVTVATDGAGNAQVTLVMRCLTTTNITLGIKLYPQIWIVPYRTEGNGTIHYRLKPLGDYPSGWLNNADTATVTYVDAIADSALTANPVLYTEGGLLDRQSPGSIAFATMHQQRLWVVGDDRRTLYYSSKILSGEAPWFNRALLSVRIDEGGDITALGSLGDKLLVFKADAVFVIFGDGANDAGGENGLSEAAILTRECGCSEPRSVVRAGSAVWFRSSRGIYRIGGDLSVAFVGKQVRDLVDDRAITTSATWDQPKGLVYWTLETSAGSDPIRLVYDIDHSAWSYDEFNSVSPKRTVAACMHGGVYYSVGNTGAIYYASGWLDETTFVPLLVETGPVHVCSLGGYQRLRKSFVLGELQSNAGLVVALAYDDEANATETHTFPAVDMAAVATVRAHSHIAKQKCRTVRAIIYDTAGAGGSSGEGVRLSTVSFEVGIKPSTTRTNPTYRK